jgi:DNA repair exonuclease SbcCD ATPase subunit
MKAREEQEHCMLCGRSIQSNTGSRLDISKRLRDLKDEVSELDELIANYELSMKTAREQMERMQRNKAAKEQDLDERMGKHYTTAFVADVEFASSQIGALQEEANRWHDYESIWSKLDTRYASLGEIQAQLTSISAKLTELRENKAQDMQKLSTLESYLDEFLRGVYRDYQFSKIDDKSYEPVVNGQSYKRCSAVQRDTTILAYYYALLKYSLHHDSNYPRFLMIDTPNKDDLDPELYTQLMHNFGALRQETEPFQLIIATRDVPNDLQDNVILNLEEDYLLKDIQFRMFE